MLALKKFIPCYAAALCIKTHSALLAAWIESNILLQLASAPFDKQDETLVPEAGYRIASHELCPVRLQHFGRRTRILHSRIEPQVVAIRIENDRHAVMDG